MAEDRFPLSGEHGAPSVPCVYPPLLASAERGEYKCAQGAEMPYISPGQRPPRVPSSRLLDARLGAGRGRNAGGPCEEGCRGVQLTPGRRSWGTTEPPAVTPRHRGGTAVQKWHFNRPHRMDRGMGGWVGVDRVKKYFKQRDSQRTSPLPGGQEHGAGTGKERVWGRNQRWMQEGSTPKADKGVTL